MTTYRKRFFISAVLIHFHAWETIRKTDMRNERRIQINGSKIKFIIAKKEKQSTKKQAKQSFLLSALRKVFRYNLFCELFICCSNVIQFMCEIIHEGCRHIHCRAKALKVKSFCFGNEEISSLNES